MRPIFWVFCRNWFLMDPLHYLSSRSDFGVEFAEIFVIKKWLPDSAFEYLKENSANRRVRSAKFIWAPYAQLFSLAEAPHLGSNTIAILVSQERRHLFVTHKRFLPNGSLRKAGLYTWTRSPIGRIYTLHNVIFVANTFTIPNALCEVYTTTVWVYERC